MKIKYPLPFRAICSLFFALFAISHCLSQSTPMGKESLNTLSDETIKREVASFAIAGFSKSQNVKPSSLGLKRIPVSSCTDSSINFYPGILGPDIEVLIQAGEGGSIKKVELVRNTRHRLVLPQNAISGIYEPKFCSKGNSDCRVFYSKDKRRFYIYMLNSSGDDKYEVTWIIQGGTYYGRVIDKLK